MNDESNKINPETHRPDGSPRPPCKSTNATWLAEWQDYKIRRSKMLASPASKADREEYRIRLREARKLALQGMRGASAPFGGGYDG